VSGMTVVNSVMVDMQNYRTLFFTTKKPADIAAGGCSHIPPKVYSMRVFSHSRIMLKPRSIAVKYLR